MLYARRSEELDINNIDFNSIDLLTAENSKGFYVFDKDRTMSIQTMLSGPGDPPFSKAYPEETKRLSYINSDEAALTAFAEGSISYIIAGIKEADSFNQKAAGLYSMNAINFDKVYAVYSDIFCISGKASEAETEAARMMLVYMLGEEQQKLAY